MQTPEQPSKTIVLESTVQISNFSCMAVFTECSWCLLETGLEVLVLLLTTFPKILMRNPGRNSSFAGHIIFFLLGLLLWSLVPTPGRTAPLVRSMTEYRHQNVVLQQWELSCAAAALATILRYQHGLPVTERSVALSLIDRREYLANPDFVRLRQGFSLLDLKRFVDTLGYTGVGLGQMNLADLLLRAPVIVPVNLQGFPHFVVFRGATSGSVLLADPAFGNVSMSREKFLDGWIKYQDIGRVGFIVTRDGTPSPPARLSARILDFVLLR